MKAKLMKSFYSCIDTFFEGTNAEQHNIINTMAKRENGKIIFYGAEDYFVADSQPFILPKLKRTKNIEGVIFFTLNQFCYGNYINLSLLVNILKLEISVHFAREDITIKNLNDLKVKHLDLIGYYHAAFKKNITIK
jgi:hypothetical protein